MLFQEFCATLLTATFGRFADVFGQAHVLLIADCQWLRR
jgi:hypothetical protein